MLAMVAAVVTLATASIATALANAAGGGSDPTGGAIALTPMAPQTQMPMLPAMTLPARTATLTHPHLPTTPRAA